MRQVQIENPILNSPFEEPKLHFRFDEEGITSEVVEHRRTSAYFIPVPKPKKRGKQLSLPTEWTEERLQENTFINAVRERVARWRAGGYVGITATTRKLLEYWKNDQRERRLFFCQIEALETAIYITEVASRYGDAWIENDLRQFNEANNPGLNRIAFKMATGSGKTVVMAMLIAWNALNKLAAPQDSRFSDTFLIVTPGITIRDRLRVLLPNDVASYYDQLDLVPADLRQELNRAKVLITNFHAFLLREQGNASKIAKAILRAEFKETPDQMVRRVCRELGNKKNVIVINDEAHHCYRHRPSGDEEDVELKGDEKKEAQKREEDARIWISGVEAVKAKIGVRAIYDLSATPFFLRGSGYREGKLFPWVVSDFSLIDAIESGIVKVPRVPVTDDSGVGDQPTYRDLWLRIRDELPKKGRKTEKLTGEPRLPVELEGALRSLYGNYQAYYRRWEETDANRDDGATPPVFIVVCNNTNVSSLVFRWIAGWEKPLGDDESVLVPGNLDIFSNVGDDRWIARPNTILIDSQQLESGDAMSAEFKKIAAVEIEEFKEEYRRRFPGRDVDALTDEDLLREVMNTVGKRGKLGENVKCVVSVSMLTEGWDANTVTHILGVRAFGTQLLCEQVVGRGLRRRSYAPNDEGKFEPEYAEVYGVPFSFIPSAGTNPDPKPEVTPTRVRALEDRADREITFPRIVGYKYEVPAEHLTWRFTEDSRLALSTEDVPTRTENAPIVGELSIHTLDELRSRREQEVAFWLAKQVLETFFRDPEGNVAKPWLFPQIAQIARRWMTECLTCKDDVFPQLLLLAGLRNAAAKRIYEAIVASDQGRKTLKPIPKPYDTVGSTRWVEFETRRPVSVTSAEKCHISHVVADTDSWEQKVAQTLESMDRVISYVKNHNLGFTIPYTIAGEERHYTPDFIVHLRNGAAEPLNLIVEVSGAARRDKAEKVATARNLWVPAVNNDGRFGRWAFLEIRDPWNLRTEIEAFLNDEPSRQDMIKESPRPLTGDLPVAISGDAVAEICRKWGIRKLSIFGSALREDFTPASDVDVLVELDPSRQIGLDFVTIGDELSAVLGRQVDLHTAASISRHFRKEVLSEARTIYDAT